MTSRPVWVNIPTGGGGGFTSGIVFSEKVSGLSYLRTDIGGLYRGNSDGSWTQLLDKMVSTSNWGHYGVDAVAADPVNGDKVYCAVGMYTSSWDPNNGAIYRSSDRGNTWTASPLPFKVGANMSGRGMGERLAIDPNNPSILYFGARAGKGLWKSTDGAVTWSQVTQFPNVGNYVAEDSSNPERQVVGLAFVTFDKNSSTPGSTTSRIFVGVADTSKSIYVTNDAGSTWTLLGGQPLSTGTMPHKGKLSPQEKCLYITYCDVAGPDGGTKGSVWKYNIANSTWTNITPPKVWDDQGAHGYGGLAVDLQKPGTVMVAALTLWWPDALIWRSTNGGITWSPSFKWAWGQQPELPKAWTIRNDNAPWIPTQSDSKYTNLPSGWWIESLEINPFWSDNFIYGTGMTVYSSTNLTQWDAGRQVILDVSAKGIEETAVRAVCCPPAGAYVFTGSGDVGGFRHERLQDPPLERLPFLTSSSSVDWANTTQKKIIIRTGQGNKDGSQLAISKDMGFSGWYTTNTAENWWTNGQAVISADGRTIVWSTSNAGVQICLDEGSWRKITDLPQGVGLAADKVNAATIWAWSSTTLYRSTDTGATWKSVFTPSKAIKKAVVTPMGRAGDVWVSTLDGLYHSVDTGNTFVKIGASAPDMAPTAGWSFALGRADFNSSEASRYGFVVYGFFTVGGVTDLWMSIEAGYRPENCKWYRMGGSGGWGDHTSNHVGASADFPGRVFVGTNGRGLWHCENATPWMY